MTASLKTHAWELMALALFYFVFLGGEYFFDATLASFMSPADVVLNQGMILGASAVGFCCFEPFSRTPRRVRLGCSIVSMVVGFGGIAVLFAQPSLLLMQVIGVICFYLLGVLGGAVHWAASRKIAGFDHAALLVGIAYAAGIAMQFVANAAFSDRLAASIALAVGAAALLVVCRRCFAGGRCDGATRVSGGPMPSERDVRDKLSGKNVSNALDASDLPKRFPSGRPLAFGNRGARLAHVRNARQHRYARGRRWGS